VRRAWSRRAATSASALEYTHSCVADLEANVDVSGVRACVDGIYRIHDLDHRLTKRGGFRTSIQVRQPQGGAGKDTRA